MPYCMCVNSSSHAESNYPSSYSNIFFLMFIFLDAMTMLGNRMDGTLNIETFLLTLEIEISNGIMNMQNNGLSISTKVRKVSNSMVT